MIRLVNDVFGVSGTSIFVSNLPMDAMPPQVHELFKEFGPIKEHGVQVRSSNVIMIFDQSCLLFRKQKQYF